MRLCLLRKLQSSGGTPHALCGTNFSLNLTNQEAPFDNADFEAIKAITDRSDYVGSLGDRHFIVELPWEAGAKTNMLLKEDVRENARVSLGLSEEQLDRAAGKTSLLHIRSSEHPLYGKGILSTLELPLFSDDPATVQVANELNGWELSGADLAPHFGAWCVGNRTLSYVRGAHRFHVTLAIGRWC